MNTQTARILSTGAGRYYVNLGATRLRQDYATPANAKKAAEAKGYTVEGNLPDPNATSVAHLCKFFVTLGSPSRLEVHLNKHGDDDQVITFTGPNAIDLANEFFYKLGWKPVRLTSNMLNRTGGQFLIDADTPSYCDPGSEAYHSM